MVALELKQRIQTVLVHAQSAKPGEKPDIRTFKVFATTYTSVVDDLGVLVEVPAKVQVRGSVVGAELS